MQIDDVYVAPGMPPLDNGDKAVSFFEFWPMWLMYIPVVFQWLVLALRHRSLTLPLIANPNLPLSGMVGVGKTEIMQQAHGSCAESILPWVHQRVSAQPLAVQAQLFVVEANAIGIEYPFVCKPDIGCRGSGVKLIHNQQQLENYLDAYPVGTCLLIQQLASWEPEAGVFYVRRPGDAKGRIVSMALKYSPYVVGDGESTLEELIAQDGRAGDLAHLYTERHRENLHRVLEQGEIYRLVFSISHCRGAIFRDAKQFITPALTDRINQLMSGLPEFYYGRLDIKFSSVERLQQGKDMEIVEINAASSESLHIWDRNARFGSALGTLLWQYRTLFKFGQLNRKRGFTPPGLTEVLERWREEKRLAQFYPLPD